MISVIICTRNRAQLLEDALRSVTAQDYPPPEYEIVVVDNGSTDETGEVVRRAGGERARYVHEPRIGLCIARNTGWQAARGRIVAYFDDDALARPGWLRAIHDTFARDDGSIGVAGGRIDPIWLAPRPPWLPDAIAGSLTIIDWGADEKIIEDLDREWLAGANMALPKHVLAAVSGFHPWLDRVGNNLLSSGDVFLQRTVRQRGYKCVYVPAMAIEHLVSATRLERAWFLRRFYWQGVSDAVMHIIERSPSLPGRAAAALRRTVRLARNRRRLRALLVKANSPDAFALQCFALIDLGFILGLLGAARR
jgi:glycosyltransferase involved in cell wall biosynthesis